MKIIIVGGGETGLTIAKLFEEAEVTIVEIDEILCKELTSKTNALILQTYGDAKIIAQLGKV